MAKIARYFILIVAGIVLARSPRSTERGKVQASFPLPESRGVVENKFDAGNREPSLFIPRALPATLLERLAANAAQLDPEDQSGLDLLFEKAERELQKNEEKFFEEFESHFVEWVNRPFEETFFVLMSFIKFSRDPVRLVDIVFESQVPKKQVSVGHHGEPVFLEDHQERIQSFVLSYLRRSLSSRASLSSLEETRLFDRALEVTRTAKSLDLAIEGAHFMRIFSDTIQADAARVLEHRPSDERKILLAILIGT